MESDVLHKIQINKVTNEIYQKLLQELKWLGEFELEAKKTSLHITHGRAFLGVHPRKAGLLLNIVTDKPLESSRVKKLEHVSAQRYHNEILINSTEELDEELGGWLQAAYALTVKE